MNNQVLDKYIPIQGIKELQYMHYNLYQFDGCLIHLCYMYVLMCQFCHVIDHRISHMCIIV